MTLLYILYALIGVSIIVLIHEAGHFLAAKRVGVRVERFSLGFDPPVRGRNLRFFSFRKGDTEYVLGMIPFGGYVKLAGGEALADPDRQPAPDELPGKSVGARALVFAAGSAMNVLSAFVFFMIAFAMGVSFDAPIVGDVPPRHPAWEAGLRPEDTILAIDGKEVLDFGDVRLAVALASRSEPLNFQVARPTPAGGEETLEIRVTPRFDRAAGLNEIRASPAWSNVLGEPEPGTIAEKAGLRAGDRIEGFKLGGVELPPLTPSGHIEAFLNWIALRPMAPFAIKVGRGEEELWIPITPAKKDGGKPGPQIGVQPGNGNVVRGIRPGAEAVRFLEPLDEVLAMDGIPLLSVDWIELIEKWRGTEGDVVLKVRSAAGVERPVTASRAAFLAWCLKNEIAWDAYRTRILSLEADSALATAGLRARDLVIAAGGKPVFSPDDLNEIVERNRPEKIPLKVVRDGAKEPMEVVVDGAALAAARGLAWQSVPVLGTVIPGGPAQQAGIGPGSRILRVGGKTLSSWEDMTAEVRGLKAGTAIEVAWQPPEGEERQATVTVGLEPMETIGLPIDFRQKMVRAGIVDSFRLGARRTVVTAKHIFLTLRSLIQRDVSPRHLSGPVGITHILTKVVEQGRLSFLIYIIALISINLGLFNLLPFPILDGGHLLFLAIEKVKGSPVDIRIQEWATNVAFILILALALYVTYNDIGRLLG
jgi:regulator of sigma E protease